MHEREITEDPYWSDHVLLDEVAFPDGAALLRLRLLQTEEAYHGRTIIKLIPLR